MLKFYVKVFYVMGKALSGELSCPSGRSCYERETTFVSSCLLSLDSNTVPKRGLFTEQILCIGTDRSQQTVQT